MNPDTLYIKISRSTLVYDRSVTIGDVAKAECTNEAMLRQVKQMKLVSFPDADAPYKRRIEVFSILRVVELIHETYPSLTIVNEGEKDFIVEYLPHRRESRLMDATKTGLLCVVIFFGAAFTIMAFNNDISVNDVFAKLYLQVTGNVSDGVTELEVCYSIGLALGIVIFFNHLGRKKITPDPTPIQVEMRKYEKDIDNTFIENAERKGHSIDVE